MATEATSWLHGRAAADAAAETARLAFEEGAAAAGLQAIRLAPGEIDAGVPALDAFLKAGLIDSKGEGRRHIKAGALKVNDIPLTDERKLGAGDLVYGAIKLSVGRKKHVLARVS